MIKSKSLQNEAGGLRLGGDEMCCKSLSGDQPKSCRGDGEKLRIFQKFYGPCSWVGFKDLKAREPLRKGSLLFTTTGCEPEFFNLDH